MDQLILAIKANLVFINNKKNNVPPNEFCRPRGRQKEIKESEKMNKNLDLARELKKGNMRVMVIPFVVGLFGMVTKED